MAYPSYVSNFTYSGDIQTKLKGITFMKDRSKKLFEYACKPDVEKFAEGLAKFVWLGTRDTTMVLMVTFILALAQKDKGADFKKCLEEMNSTELKNVFHALGKGDGPAAKNKLEKMDAFKKLFADIILSQAIKAKDEGEKTEEKALKQREEKWTGFLAQVNKIKKWKVSYSTVENNVMPILYEILPTVFAKAFKDGFNNSPVPEDTELYAKSKLKSSELVSKVAKDYGLDWDDEGFFDALYDVMKDMKDHDPENLWPLFLEIKRVYPEKANYYRNNLHFGPFEPQTAGEVTEPKIEGGK